MRTPEKIADDLDEACVVAYFDKNSTMKERNKHYAPDSGCRACIIEGIRAAQAEALDEAAKACDEIAEEFDRIGEMLPSVRVAAEAIRALKTKPPPETKP